jgi:uracil phosphoribosyltransferase
MTTTTAATSPRATWANVHVLPDTPQLRALHTVMRDRDADRTAFVTSARRVMRLLLERALDELPHERHDVETPVGATYEGVRLAVPVCGVSVVRAGDSMETELREIVPGMRLGKILVQRDKVTKKPKLYYSALPKDIGAGHVLLLDPMLATAGTALTAVQVLLEAGVAEERIVFVNLLSAPEGLEVLRDRHPGLRVVTSSVEQRLNEHAFMVPGIGDFGDRFFGTDG